VYDTSAVTGGATAYVENHYDLGSRLISQTTPSATGTTGEGSAVTHAYDRWGNVTSTTDARHYVTTYIYDSQNHLIKQTEPEVLVTDEDGTRAWQAPTKEWYYDPNGNLTGVTDENGNTTLNGYDATGELISTTDAVGAVTLYAYDGLGNQVAKQTPISAATETSPAVFHITWSDVDALGHVIAQGDFLLEGSMLAKKAQQTYVLDENGNRLVAYDAIGSDYLQEHDTTNALKHASFYSYDSQGRLLSSQTPMQHSDGVSHTYTYDVNGNKIGEKDANGNTQSWTYDYYGRMLTHVDLSGASYHYYYDLSSGLLTSETSTWNPSSPDQQANPQSDPGYVPGADRTPGGTGVQSTES
jgi:YD repeat-containing protein